MKIIALCLATACFIGCAAPAPRSEPAAVGPDDFAPARLIMSKVEDQIYAHLADAQARDEFIADFWKKRDPSPASEENEFRDDFYKRVEYANRWFHEKGPAANGWDSERGRILIMLGFPDQRDQMPMLNNTQVHAAEIWIYYNYSLHLEFLDREGMGKFRLDYWPLELLDAIDQVKALGRDAGIKNYFRFKVSSDAGGLQIEIPVKYLLVEERGNDVHAAFAVTVDVYRDYVKCDRLALTREFTESRSAFTARKTIDIAVPYAFPKPGKYSMDVVVTETVSGKRYREFTATRRSGDR